MKRFLILLVAVISCDKKVDNHVIQLDASKDSTIWVNRHNNKTSAGVKIVGNINHNAILSLQHEDITATGLSNNILLSKGNIKLNDYLSNLYGNKFKIVYHHKKVTKGKLKLTVDF